MKIIRRRVWVADDSRLERERSADALRQIYDVETFADGLEVVERFGQSAPPDVLVLDWIMTDMGGFDVIEFARAHPRTQEMAIVVVTGSIDASNVARALAAGADDFLKKPADLAELHARVARLVHRQVERESERQEHSTKSQLEQLRTVDAQTRLAAESQRAAESSELARMSQLLMGILGHDLRTPLGAISIATGLLARPETPLERRTVAIGRIRNSLARMTEMIGQLMDLTRSRSGGGIAVQRRYADARIVCEEVLAELRDAHSGREIKLETSGDTALPLDPGRLAQVISNIVGNAVQHGSSDEPIVVKVAGDASNVVIDVINSGAAIDPKTLHLLFDPFRRASEAPSRATGGLGLGLYISKRIVDAHEGELTVRSDPAATTFTVRLPRPIALEG